MIIDLKETIHILCSSCFRKLEARFSGVCDGNTGNRRLLIKPCEVCTEERVKSIISKAMETTK